jgi:hypothetical protein
MDQFDEADLEHVDHGDLDLDLPDDGTADIVDEDSSLTSAEELASRVRRLVELRAEKDETKVAADKAKAAFEKYQAEFFEEYSKSPLKGSVKVDIGGDYGLVQIVPRSTRYGRILDREAAEKYFEDRKQTAEFVKEDFRMGRLHELVREHIEQKKPLPPGIDFYTKEFFTITFKD